MNNSELAVDSRNRELPVRAASGWLLLFIILALYVAAVWAFVSGLLAATSYHPGGGGLLAASGVILVLAVTGSIGFFTLQPNEAAVLILFGAYKGTVRDSGFFWTNPLNLKVKISLRARNFNGDKLKVNDKRGNPIEIAVVVVWRVQDTAQASFDVDIDLRARLRFQPGFGVLAIERMAVVGGFGRAGAVRTPPPGARSRAYGGRARGAVRRGRRTTRRPRSRRIRCRARAGWRGHRGGDSLHAGEGGNGSPGFGLGGCAVVRLGPAARLQAGVQVAVVARVDAAMKSSSP